MPKKNSEETESDFAEELVKGIRAITKAFEQFKKAGLRERTIILLIHDATKISKGKIEIILQTIPELEKRYLLPKSKTKRKG